MSLDLEGDVLHPFRRVVVAVHLRLGRQLEEGEHIAAAGVEEHVHVGIGLPVDGTWSSAKASMKSMPSTRW